ncbi:MAG: PP2C family protein-serine/threonine phosphatase [Planctomycetaceae bacterium]
MTVFAHGGSSLSPIAGIPYCNLIYDINWRCPIRTAVRHTDDLAVLATEANCMISDFATAGRFATSFLAVIHRAECTISFVGAGHEAWLIRSNGFVEHLRPDNLPLGLDRSACYEVQHIRYRSGDLLLLATDGITEASDPDRRMFGVPRMLETVVHQRASSPNQLVQSLMSEVIEFRRGAEQQDDITAVVAKFGG